MAYAAEKGISYSDGNETTYNMGGVFLSFGGSGNTDMNKLRAYNLASDAEVRAHHPRDTELETGTSTIYKNPERSWYLATRGEKLRSCALRRKHLLKMIEEDEGRKAQLEASLRSLECPSPK